MNKNKYSFEKDFFSYLTNIVILLVFTFIATSIIYGLIIIAIQWIFGVLIIETLANLTILKIITNILVIIFVIINILNLIFIYLYKYYNITFKFHDYLINTCYIFSIIIVIMEIILYMPKLMAPM